MTDRRRSHSAHRALPMVSVMVAACAATAPSPTNVPVVPSNPTAWRLAQIGYGPGATFERCRADECPRRSSKTLPPALAATVPHAAADTDPRGQPAAGDEAQIASSIAHATRPIEASSAAEQVDVQFRFASARLTDAARAALRAVAPQLAHAAQVSVSGRTDNTGPDSANELLAKARADAVLRELEALVPGVAAVTTVDARGACCYAEANDHPAGRARNRRVEIRYRLDLDDPP